LSILTARLFFNYIFIYLYGLIILLRLWSFVFLFIFLRGVCFLFIFLRDFLKISSGIRSKEAHELDKPMQLDNYKPECQQKWSLDENQLCVCKINPFVISVHTTSHYLTKSHYVMVCIGVSEYFYGSMSSVNIACQWEEVVIRLPQCCLF
jgi:hypothetical protein